MRGLRRESPVTHTEIPGRGLSKREYFAAMALQGLLVGTHPHVDVAADQIRFRAQDAVKAADALILALNEKGES